MGANRSTLPLTLLISGALHAALLCVTLAPEPAHADAERRSGADRPDRWVGDTFDVELLDAPGAAPKPQPPEPARAAPPEPRPVPPPAPPARPPAVPPPEVAPPSGITLEPAPVPSEPEAEPSEPVAPAEPSEPAARAGASPTPASGPAAVAASDGAGEAPSTGTSFGAPGAGGAVRQLGRAFTRALPAAALPKDGWLALPLGAGPTARVTLTLDESGQLLPPDFGDESPPRIVAKLLRRAHLLLKRGRFAIADEPGAGSQTFSIRVEVSDEAAVDDPFAEPGHIMRRGFEPPRPDHPGRSHFTFASGRHIVIYVELVP